MYEQLPAGTYPETLYIEPGITISTLLEQLHRSAIQYPFIVKPDVGMKGILFRKIDTVEQLISYHQKMPVVYLIQALLEHPIELSVFYYRYPGEQKGVISGMIQKELLEVIGDGTHTLWELILLHPRAQFRLEEMRAHHGHRADFILPKNEQFYLSYAGNHNRGARFINLINEVDADLLAVFDGLSLHSGQFYYGRYDIKCNSIEALKEGKEFMILEFNGAGAEPNHIYDAGISLGAAYREILRHWKVLYEISWINREKGVAPWSFRKGWHFLKASSKHFKELEKIDVL